MSFYPIYIPLYFGGAPPPPMGPKEKLAWLIAAGSIVGGFSALVYNTYTPKFQMKLTQDINNSAAVFMRTKNYPKIRSMTNTNLECLREKGYTVNEMPYYGSYLWNQIAGINPHDKKMQPPDKLMEKLATDCKECQTSTEIAYEYDNVFGNEKQEKKKLYWYKYTN
jgi:hypothetical protein